jgi:hypothetical protein
VKPQTFRHFPCHLSVLFSFLLLVPGRPLYCQSLSNDQSKTRDSVRAVPERARLLIEQVRTASFPELSTTEIQVRILESKSDFFRSRLRLPDFFLRGKIRYVIKVNPEVFELQAPEEGLKAIMAHELGHVAYLKKKKRIQLLGMARLVSERFTADFERRTDLEAVSRGYGEGLKVFRQWLYQHIPEAKLREKKQNYFSPAEIETLLSKIQACPELLEYWLKHPPRNLLEIENQPQACQNLSPMTGRSRR